MPPQAHVPVPSPSPATDPGTYVPTEMPPIIVPPEPGLPPEVEDPQPTEPTLPIREPATHTPPQAV